MIFYALAALTLAAAWFVGAVAERHVLLDVRTLAHRLLLLISLGFSP